MSVGGWHEVSRTKWYETGIDSHPKDSCPGATCPSAAAMVLRSSFGTPTAVAARESVTDEQAARVVARAKELAEVDRVTKIIAAHRRHFRLGCRCGRPFNASAMDDEGILAEHDEHVAHLICGAEE